MATRSISIALEARVQGFVSGLKTAEQATRDFSSRTAAFARENEQQFDRVGKAAALFGGGMLAGVGLAVKSFADFDKAVSSIKASTHETAANMDLLRQAAIDAGADTAYSATEAANAIDEMAKAGVSTKDILGGGLKGALNLAAAGSLEVGRAAEIAATAVSQFGLQGKDVPHVADLLAAGAGKAQGSVDDLSLALKYVGPVAAGMGVSIEETTGTLAAFAKQGIVGDNAGTALRGMLGSLTSPSKAASDEIARLGINLYDTDGKVTGTKGKFLGLANVAGQLQGAYVGMNDAQRDMSLGLIFGNDQVTAARTLYKTGAEGVKQWTAAVDDAGYASETARTKTDNLAGDLERLGGSFDSVLIQSGSGANDVLRGLVQGLEGLVDAVGKVPGPVLGVATGFTAVIGGAGLLAGGLITVIPKIAETKAALEVLAPAGSKANAALSRTGKFAAGAAVGLAALAAAATLAQPAMDKILAPTGETADALKRFAGEAGKGAIGADTLSQSFQDLVQHKDGVNDFQSAIEGIADPGIWGNLDNIIVDTARVASLGLVNMTSTSETARNRFKELGVQLASVDAGKASDSFQAMAKQTNGSQEQLKQLLNLMPAYRKNLEDQAKSAQLATDDQTLLDLAMGKVPASMEAASGAVKGYADATGQAKPIDPAIQQKLDDLGVSAAGVAEDLDKFTQALFNAGMATMSERDATAAHQAAIDGVKGAVEDATAALAKQYEAQGMSAEAARAQAEAQMKVGAALNKTKTDFDLSTEAGRILNSQFQEVAQTGMAEIEAKAKNGAGQPELQKNLSTTFNELKKTGTGMGLTGGAADALARKVMGIPPKANINSWMSDAAKRMAEQTKGAMDAIDGKTVNTYVNHHETTLIETVRSESVRDTRGTADKGTFGRFAVGGAITGPGTGTSDDIVALLSNGEHVLTADEVRKMGGQAAVYRFRQMLDAGKLPKFAAGGAAEKATARREFWLDYQRDSRRGNGYRTVSQSLSSAYSFADKLTQLADSGNVSAAAVRRLYDAAGRGEAGLRGLHGRADKLSASLDKAKSKLSDLTQVRDRIKDNLAGGFSIADAVKQGNMYGTASMKDVTSGASSYLSRVQSFAGKLKALQKKGYSGAIVQEIAELGLTEGSKAADVLLKATAGEVKQLNKTKTDIDTAAGKAGTYVTDSMYKGGISGAQAVVKGIESQQGAIGRAMLQIGLGMENALRSALGQKPIKRAGGGPVIGPGTGTSDEVPAWLSNGEHVLTAAEVQAMGGQGGVYQFRRHLAGGYRYQPGYAPRVNVPASQPTGTVPAQQFGDVHITQQSDPVATYHEFSRRTRRLSV